MNTFNQQGLVNKDLSIKLTCQLKVDLSIKLTNIFQINAVLLI